MILPLLGERAGVRAGVSIHPTSNIRLIQGAESESIRVERPGMYPGEPWLPLRCAARQSAVRKFSRPSKALLSGRTPPSERCSQQVHGGGGGEGGLDSWSASGDFAADSVAVGGRSPVVA